MFYNRLFKLELNDRDREYGYLFTKNEICGEDIQRIIDRYKDRHNGINDDKHFIEYLEDRLEAEYVELIDEVVDFTKE